jgi:hypothetical protein
MVAAEQKETVASEVRHDQAEQAILEDLRVGEGASGEVDPATALLLPDEGDLGIDLAVELILRALELDVADEQPGERAAQQKADPDDTDRGGDEPVPETQVFSGAPSSSRYPTPQTVWMLGSVTPAAASFSRTCCTWTSTVRV